MKISLTKTLTEYEHLKNKSFLERIRNKDSVELSDYKKLANPVYTEDIIETKKSRIRKYNGISGNCQIQQ